LPETEEARMAVREGPGRRRSGVVSAASLALAGLLALGAAAAAVSAPAKVELRVVPEGPGFVRTPSGKIQCGSTCSATFARGKLVTLLAQGGETATFTGWSGACTGALPRCTIFLDRPATATARFKPAVVRVEVAVGGLGRVTSEPAGISCGAGAEACVDSFVKRATLMLTASPSPSSGFAGWLGACSGTGPCELAPGEETSVRAVFRRVHAVSATATGAGTVESDLWPGCDLPCSAVSPSGGVTALRAVPAGGQSFRGWTGACTGAAATCVLRTDQPGAVDASFGAPPLVPGSGQLVAVTRAGPGNVTGGGIACGTVCAARPSASTITLTAAPSAGAVFAGWGGDCSGTAPTCQLTLASARSVTATFGRAFTLAYTPGSGNPTVRITPPGITCAAPCTTTVGGDELVTLAVDVPTPTNPDVRARVFWAQACVGGGPACTLAVDAGTAVTAHVTLVAAIMGVRFGLVVSLTRKGTVTAEGTGPEPFACVRSTGPKACSAVVVRDRDVTLTATPVARFVRWVGSCSGTKPKCAFSMTAAKTVIAQFRKP
jgi:hypothetical protein